MILKHQNSLYVNGPQKMILRNDFRIPTSQKKKTFTKVGVISDQIILAVQRSRTTPLSAKKLIAFGSTSPYWLDPGTAGEDPKKGVTNCGKLRK